MSEKYEKNDCTGFQLHINIFVLLFGNKFLGLLCTHYFAVNYLCMCVCIHIFIYIHVSCQSRGDPELGFGGHNR